MNKLTNTNEYLAYWQRIAEYNEEQALADFTTFVNSRIKDGDLYIACSVDMAVAGVTFRDVADWAEDYLREHPTYTVDISYIRSLGGAL